MARIGIISPPVPGHLNPFLALAGELRDRGHRVIFFAMPDVEASVRADNIGFRPIGASDHPPGSLPESLRQLSARKGLAALRFTIGAIARTTRMICRDAPEAIQAEGADLLLVDQTEPAGGSVAEKLGIPFVTVMNALPMNREPRVPPPFTPWKYDPGPFGQIRNRIGYGAADAIQSPVRRILDDYRRQWGLPAAKDAAAYDSRLAQISQLSAAFDFPRSRLPDCFHYAGPFRQSTQPEIAFPWDRLDGRPLVYASLGTLQGAHEEIFRCFAQACHGLGVQAVISHGRRLSAEQSKRLEEWALVVEYAPQLALLEKASAVITHAGLNTVLDAVSRGVPMVAVPLTFEQPGTASRILWTGTGQVIEYKRLSTAKVATALNALLNETVYRDNAERISRAMSKERGVRTAADLIDRVVAAGQPV